MSFTTGTNPLDPMMKSGPEKEEALFEAFNILAAGRPLVAERRPGHDYSTVAGAAINLLANAVRQNCETRQRAEKMFDELVGRTKNLLLEKHYDPVTNKRRNVFPHTQVVHAELVHWDPKKNRNG